MNFSIGRRNSAATPSYRKETTGKHPQTQNEFNKTKLKQKKQSNICHGVFDVTGLLSCVLLFFCRLKRELRTKTTTDMIYLITVRANFYWDSHMTVIKTSYGLVRHARSQNMYCVTIYGKDDLDTLTFESISRI